MTFLSANIKLPVDSENIGRIYQFRESSSYDLKEYKIGWNPVKIDNNSNKHFFTQQ